MYEYETFNRYHDMNNFCVKVYNVNIASYVYGGRVSMIRSNRLSSCFIYLWLKLMFVIVFV